MVKRVLGDMDSVQINGWTPDTARRAVAALSRLAGNQSAEDEDGELGLGILQSLQHAVEEDPRDLADYLEANRPSDPASWGWLQDTLAKKMPLDEVVTRIKERHPDHVSMLCTLLDVGVPPQIQWSLLEQTHRRAVEVLIKLATPESLTYLLKRMSLLCGEQRESLEEVIVSAVQPFGDAALAVWPLLDWADRPMVLLFLVEYKIPRDGVIELLFSIDGKALDYSDRESFVEALASCDDPRALSVIHELIDHALEEMSSHPTDAGRNFVAFAIHQLREMDAEPTLEQYQRAVACGVPCLTEPVGPH